MGKTIRGARKGKNSIFTAHTRLRKGPVRLRKIDYAEKCAGRVPLSRLFDRPIGATAARQIPVLKVTCSNHVSVTAALSLGGPGGGLQFHSRFATERFDSVWAAAHTSPSRGDKRAPGHPYAHRATAAPSRGAPATTPSS